MKMEKGLLLIGGFEVGQEFSFSFCFVNGVSFPPPGEGGKERGRANSWIHFAELTTLLSSDGMHYVSAPHEQSSVTNYPNLTCTMMQKDSSRDFTRLSLTHSCY